MKTIFVQFIHSSFSSQHWTIKWLFKAQIGMIFDKTTISHWSIFNLFTSMWHTLTFVFFLIFLLLLLYKFSTIKHIVKFFSSTHQFIIDFISFFLFKKKMFRIKQLQSIKRGCKPNSITVLSLRFLNQILKLVSCLEKSFKC